MNTIRGKLVSNTMVGDILILAQHDVITNLYFLNYENITLNFIMESSDVLDKAEEFLKGYFFHKHWYQFQFIKFDKLRFSKHYKMLMNIKFGETITYSDFYPSNPRFGGYVLSLNPLPIFIPCHRVISKNSIGGYTPHLEIKKTLLKHEGIDD